MFELAPSVTIFTDNKDFFGGNTFSQAPIYAVQKHNPLQFSVGHVDGAGRDLFRGWPHRRSSLDAPCRHPAAPVRYFDLAR
jgi:hypothetical protein